MPQTRRERDRRKTRDRRVRTEGDDRTFALYREGSQRCGGGWRINRRRKES